MLGLSERHFRRLRDAYEAAGAEGIIDGRRGRASGRRAPVDEIEWVLGERLSRGETNSRGPPRIFALCESERACFLHGSMPMFACKVNVIASAATRPSPS